MIWALGLLAAVEAIDLAEYRRRLDALAERVERGDVEGARDLARSLLEAGRVRAGGEELGVDVPLLRPLSEAKDAAALRERAGRLKALREGLERELEPDVGNADLPLLERLRRERASEEAKRGGEIWSPPAPEVPLTLWERLVRALEWVGDKVSAFWRWLRELFAPRRSVSTGDGKGMSRLVVVLALVVVLLLAVLAWAAWRRRRVAAPAPAPGRSTPAKSAQDEDPLSRTAGEWERFARELAKSGRFREAVRAWFHAALVSCFRAGVLHYRKERTNWEYAYAVPAAPWRADFLDLTRVFEREWYGRRETSDETHADAEGRALRVLGALRAGAAR